MATVEVAAAREAKARGLTELAIEKLKPATARREIPDAGKRGLFLIIQPSGKKSLAI
jgi:hypothetical protein